MLQSNFTGVFARAGTAKSSPLPSVEDIHAEASELWRELTTPHMASLAQDPAVLQCVYRLRSAALRQCPLSRVARVLVALAKRGMPKASALRVVGYLHQLVVQLYDGPPARSLDELDVLEQRTEAAENRLFTARRIREAGGRPTTAAEDLQEALAREREGAIELELAAALRWRASEKRALEAIAC